MTIINRKVLLLYYEINLSYCYNIFKVFFLVGFFFMIA